MSDVDPKNLYRDDILNIGFECGCMARASAIGKNDHGGDRMIIGYGSCRAHEGISLECLVAQGKLTSISIIKGLAARASEKGE